MKILLDTNIVIHREATTVVDEDIGILFRWLDNLHHIKCIHSSINLKDRELGSRNGEMVSVIVICCQDLALVTKSA